MRTRHLPRLTLGVAQLLAPGPLAALLTGTVLDRRARAATRVLGARHVTQGLVTASRPTPLVLGLG
ncbi:MAG TPA: hypothetical protein VE152_14395, partial [Acidimicrobiales bacterium]|nr:hypothetical protein [Acidimicrobiales bacterium]